MKDGGSFTDCTDHCIFFGKFKIYWHSHLFPVFEVTEQIPISLSTLFNRSLKHILGPLVLSFQNPLLLLTATEPHYDFECVLRKSDSVPEICVHNRCSPSLYYHSCYTHSCLEPPTVALVGLTDSCQYTAFPKAGHFQHGKNIQICRFSHVF